MTSKRLLSRTGPQGPPPKSLAAAMPQHVWGAGRMLLFRPGRWFYPDETHFQHTHVFGASVSTVTKVTCGIVTQVTMQGTLQEAFHCIRSCEEEERHSF